MAKGAKEGGSQNIGSKEGGYKDLRDRFDGGGPGRSGDRFEGGGIFSAIGNALGGPGAIGFGPRDGGGDGATMSTRSSDGILGNVLDPRTTPGRVAGGMLGSLALGPIGGIIGSLIGQQMMQQAQAERAAREQATEQNQPLMNPVKFAGGGDVRPGFFGMLAGLGNEGQSGLFGGLGSLGRMFFGDDETGPDMDQVEALREALEAGEISQDTYETMYARLLLDESSRDPAMGLLNLSNYVLKAGEPQAPNQLSTTISRGSGGSGARALGRLGAQPLV